MTAAVPHDSAVLTVDLGAVAANYEILKKKAGPACAVAGVVKADAYGLGMEKIWAALENAGCPFYFVAAPDEALSLRRLTKKPVAVLGGIWPGTEDEFIRHSITPVLNTPDDIARWRAAAARHSLRLPAILHFDTGMNRLGLIASPDEIDAEGMDIKYVMSHFACADEKDSPMTAAQFEKFMKVASHFPGVKKSIAASSGIFRSADYRLDMARPGMALYGLNPAPEAANPMKPVVFLSARVLQVKKIRRGGTVGYGSSFRADKDITAAAVALGYADGFLRALGNRGALYCSGVACPVVGRVSMDIVTVDVTAAALVREGDFLEVIGPHQGADDLAAAAGTIGYEILTSLGPRYRRVYKS
ncbi:MAG: alanine racemase [Proteobacteria bacterium]|nr:alanine racemase [Pseudomonadota bacterium]